MPSKYRLSGNGYWGKKLSTQFHDPPFSGSAEAVCDSRSKLCKSACNSWRGLTCSSLKQSGTIPISKGWPIAARPRSASRTRQACLRAGGKDVYVEKTPRSRSPQGQEIVTSRRRQPILMVGHILQYHPAILRLTELIGKGELGRIQSIYSSRLNGGKLRTEENILGVRPQHDISAILIFWTRCRWA